MKILVRKKFYLKNNIFSFVVMLNFGKFVEIASIFICYWFTVVHSKKRAGFRKNVIHSYLSKDEEP